MAPWRAHCVLVLALLLAWPARAGVFVPHTEHGVPDEYLVVLAPAGRVPGALARLERAYGFDADEQWSHALDGFVARLSEARARALAHDVRVQAVEQNVASWTSARWPTSSTAGHCLEARPALDLRPLPIDSPQAIRCDQPDPARVQPASCQDNWGLDRIDQRGPQRDGRYAFEHGWAARQPVYVFVLDTGINREHREFLDESGRTRIAWGADATVSPVDDSLDADISDCYPSGHGTHVAGIVAGRTYGVAKQVRLVPVKIVGCGSALTSAAVRALDWIAAHPELRPAVVNWSGANDPAYLDSLALREALRRVLDAGLVVVQSAGNQSGAFRSGFPGDVQDACDWSWGGSFPEVIVAAGSDAQDQRWVTRAHAPDYDCWRDPATLELHGSCGSNVGRCVDLWAPAADVLSASALTNDGYCRLSGTSMAAAHVSGVAALYLQAHPQATAEQVARALRAQGTAGVLRSERSNPWAIGADSPNVLLYSRVP